MSKQEWKGALQAFFFSSVVRSWWWSFLPPVVSNFKKLLMCVDVLEYVFSARVGY